MPSSQLGVLKKTQIGRIHNPGFVRNELGHLPIPGKLDVLFTGNNAQDWNGCGDLTQPYLCNWNKVEDQIFTIYRANAVIIPKFLPMNMNVSFD